VAPEVEAIDLDDWAGEVEAAQPLSQVSLQRGYVTSAGNESVSATPYYVTRVTYRQGLDGGRIRYEAVDGWGLLNLWAADHALQWSNRSIAWLLADLAAQVGLGYEDDGCARLSTTLSSFRLPPRVSAAAAVLALLRLSRCVARLTEDAWSKLSVLALPLTSTPADIGDEGELLWGEHGLALVNPTTVTVAGSGVVARDGEPTLAMRQGLDVPRTIEEGRATSATLAENVRDSVLALSRARWRADRVEVHLRPELEPWDRVTLDDPCAAIGDDPDRTVLALKESFSFFSGEYTSTLTLGADLG